MLTEMPLYDCHKRVRALKIQSVRSKTDIRPGSPYTHSIIFEDGAYAPRSVTGDWVKSFDPQPGGYLVEYNDGYLSYSPAKAFEEGYNKVVPK